MSFRKVKVTSYGRQRNGTTNVESGTYGPSASQAWRQRQETRRASQPLHPLTRAGEAGRRNPSSPEDPTLWQDDTHVEDSPPRDDGDHNTHSVEELVDIFLRDSHSSQFYMSSSRNWGRRRARAEENWQSQMRGLVDAYLACIHSSPASGAPAPTLYPGHSVSAETVNRTTLGFITLVDVSGVYAVPNALFASDRHVNVALLANGYLGCSPVRPTTAFSLRLLLLFVRLRIRARTGKHNFTRVLCDLHNITFTRSLRNRLSNAVDALAVIQRNVDSAIRTTLGRDNVWRMKNACPACAYTPRSQCTNESVAPLAFARQFALDGNNSMKRFISAGTRFDRPYEFYYFKTRAEVDEFKDEVQRGRTAPPSAVHGSDAVPPHETDCTQRWRNAAPENERSRPSDVIDETGIFVCTCRHGFVVIVTDMWQSGELAKYPLSIVKTLLDLFQDEGKLEIGYDIGCAHSVTAANSSFGPLAKEHIRFVVGSFHGHAHDRLCQLRFHPRYITGSGREDFEGCERLFSVNNFIAPLICHATRYHRHELIEASLAAWDAEKYSLLGSLLLSKFLEAKSKIAEHADDERLRQRTPEYTSAYFEHLLADEREYLAGKASRTPQEINDEISVEYAAMLRRWWHARAERDKIDPFIQHAPGTRDGTNRKWLGVQRRIQTYEEHLARFEERLGIASHERWTPSTREYTATLQADRRHAYESALDALERSVADRTAVLEKLNRRGTGYNLRRQIAKAVTRRGAAFGAALQKYNEAALALDPPRPTLTREEVLNIATLADFPLLREDTGARPWAQPTVRRLTTAWAETARAEEELARIRVESIRVRAWIRDEEAAIDALIDQLSSNNSLRDRLLAMELDTRAQLQFHVHTGILDDLRRLDEADGLVRARQPGHRPGQDPVAAAPARASVRVRRPPLPADILAVRDPTPLAPNDQSPSPVGSMDSRDSLQLDEVAELDLQAIFTAIDEVSD